MSDREYEGDTPDCGPGTGDEDACNKLRGCQYTEGECLPVGYKHKPMSKKK